MPAVRPGQSRPRARASGPGMGERRVRLWGKGHGTRGEREKKKGVDGVTMLLCYDALLWRDEVVVLENLWRAQCARAVRAHAATGLASLARAWDLPQDVCDLVLAQLREPRRPLTSAVLAGQRRGLRCYEGVCSGGVF